MFSRAETSSMAAALNSQSFERWNESSVPPLATRVELATLRGAEAAVSRGCICIPIACVLMLAGRRVRSRLGGSLALPASGRATLLRSPLQSLWRTNNEMVFGQFLMRADGRCPRPDGPTLRGLITAQVELRPTGQCEIRSRLSGTFALSGNDLGRAAARPYRSSR